MRFLPTELEGLVIVEPQVFADSRGFFMECYHRDKFKEAGIAVSFVQENQSRCLGRVLRGLHYQEPKSQGKLVRAVRGAIFDVAVDIRKGSPAFGKWAGVELSDENHRLLWIPPGFAHGFCALSQKVEVVYLCTEVYMPEAEHVMTWNDPDLAIDWPVRDPILSARDAAGKRLSEISVLPVFGAGS